MAQSTQNTIEEATYDETMEIIGNGKFQYFLLFVTGFSLMSVIIEALNMAFVLPSAKCEITYTQTEQSLIGGVGFMGVILSSHIWGFLNDTWGRQKVLRLALGTTFSFSVLSSMSNSGAMLMVTRFIVGFW